MGIQSLESRIQKKGIKSRVAPGGQAVSFPTRTTTKRVEVEKGGCEIGKWRNFSHLETALTHLFPDKSTQVVDFPHLAYVRLFSEGCEIPFSGPNCEVAI